MVVYADAAAATAGGSPYGMIIYFVLIILFFWFLIIRPQKKRDKQVKEMLAAIKKGDKVTTIGGVVGKISKIKDDVVTIEVGPDNVPLVFERRAIASVESKVSE